MADAHDMQELVGQTENTIVRSTGIVKFHDDENIAIPRNCDLCWSLLATAYHLMRSNPVRFADRIGDDCTWGFTHEDWHRAILVVKFVNARRSSPLKPGQTRKLDTYIAGFADDEAIAEAVEAGKDARNTAGTEILRNENAYDSTYQDFGQAGDIEQPTEEDTLSLVLRHPRISSIQDPDKQLEAAMEEVERCKKDAHHMSDVTTAALVNVLGKQNSSVDLMDSLERKSTARTVVPITRDEKSEVKVWLNHKIKVVHNGPGEELLASCGSKPLMTNEEILDLSARLESERYALVQQLQDPRGAHDIQELDERLQEYEEAREQEELAEMDRLRHRRQRLGERKPDNEDLEAICELHGVPLSTLQVNPHRAQTRNLPPQIVDAHHIQELLQSPLHAAFLSSECGTGKTRVYGTALKWLCDDHEAAVKAGKIELAEGERLFKPHFIGLPCGLVDQCFNELTEDFRGVFDIYCFYQSRSRVSNLRRSAKTIDNLGELQEKVDELAARSDDPKTGRTVIIAAYTTITSRVAAHEETVRVPSDAYVDADSNRDARNQGFLDPTGEGKTDLMTSQKQQEKTTLHGDDKKDEKAASGSNCVTEESQSSDEVHIRGRPAKLYNSAWGLVILDDCHSLKNPCSTIHKVISSLPREATLLVSAEALLNHVRDVLGYLGLIWNPAWPFSISKNKDEPLDNYFDPNSYASILRDGHFGDITLDRLTSRAVGDPGPLHLSSTDKRRASEYESFIRDGRGPLHLLNPALFQKYAKQHEWSTDVSVGGVKTIMDLMSLKRGMLTEMEMPDSSRTCLGKGMKGLKILTVELEPTREDRDELHEYCESLSPALLMNNERTAPELVPGGAVMDAPKKLLNTSVVRRLTCVSTDLRNKALTRVSARNTRMLNDVLAAFDVMKGKNRPRMADEVIKGKALQQSGKPVANGTVKHIERFRLTDPTGGLKLHFYWNRPSDAYSFPVLRSQQVKVVTNSSPKCLYALREAYDAQAKGEKLLILVNCPLTSQLLNARMVAAGIRTLHYMSRNPQRERDVAISTFNDPSSPHTCLITSLQLSAFGVNLHKACHRGIILERPINLSHELQALGRLYRIGQKHDVVWKILICRNSFDSYFEARNIRKFVTTLTAEGKIPSIIQGENRVICAYEILRDQLGQSCSRYPRTRVKWDQMDSDEIFREGLFYSALARWMLANPDEVHLFDQEKVVNIAASWEPGTQLTTKHVKGEREALPDGRGVAIISLNGAEHTENAVTKEPAVGEDRAKDGKPDVQGEGQNPLKRKGECSPERDNKRARLEDES